MIDADELRANNLSNDDIITDMISETKVERTIILGITNIIEGSAQPRSTEEEDSSDGSSDAHMKFHSKKDPKTHNPPKGKLDHGRTESKNPHRSSKQRAHHKNSQDPSKHTSSKRYSSKKITDYKKSSSSSTATTDDSLSSANRPDATSFVQSEASFGSSMHSSSTDSPNVSKRRASNEPVHHQRDRKREKTKPEDNENRSKNRSRSRSRSRNRNRSRNRSRHRSRHRSCSTHRGNSHSPTKIVDSISQDVKEINMSLSQAAVNDHDTVKITSKSPLSGSTDFSMNEFKLDLLSLDDSAFDMSPSHLIQNPFPGTREPADEPEEKNETGDIKAEDEKEEITVSPQLEIAYEGESHVSKLFIEDMKNVLSGFLENSISELPIKSATSHQRQGRAKLIQPVPPEEKLKMREEILDARELLQKAREGKVPTNGFSTLDLISIRRLFVHNMSKETLHTLKELHHNNNNEQSDQASFLSTQPSIQLPLLHNKKASQISQTEQVADLCLVIPRVSLDSSPIFEEDDVQPMISADSMMELIAQHDGSLFDVLSAPPLESPHSKELKFETNEGLIKTLNSAFELDDDFSVELKKYDDLVYSFANDLTMHEKSPAGETQSFVHEAEEEEEEEEEEQQHISRTLKPLNTGNTLLSGKYDLFLMLSSKFSNPLSGPTLEEGRGRVVSPFSILTAKTSKTPLAPVASKDEYRGGAVSPMSDNVGLPTARTFPLPVDQTGFLQYINTPSPNTGNDIIEVITNSNPESRAGSFEEQEQLPQSQLKSESDYPECNKSMLSPGGKSVLSPAGTVTAKLYEDIGIGFDGPMDKTSTTRPRTRHFIEDLNHADTVSCIDAFSIQKENFTPTPTPTAAKKTSKPLFRSLSLSTSMHRRSANDSAQVDSMIELSFESPQPFNKPTESAAWRVSNRFVNPQGTEGPKRRKTFRKILFSSLSRNSSAVSSNQKDLTPLFEDKHSILSWPRSLFRSRSSSSKKYADLNLDSGESISGFAVDYSLDFLKPTGRGLSMPSFAKKADSRIDDVGMVRANKHPVARENGPVANGIGYTPSPFPAPIRQNSMLVRGRNAAFGTKADGVHDDSQARELFQSMGLVSNDDIPGVKRVPTIRFAPSPKYIASEAEPHAEDDNLDAAQFGKRALRKVSSDTKTSSNRSSSNSSLFGTLNIKSIFHHSGEQHGESVKEDAADDLMFDNSTDSHRPVGRSRSLQILRKLSIFK